MPRSPSHTLVHNRPPNKNCSHHGCSVFMDADKSMMTMMLLIRLQHTCVIRRARRTAALASTGRQHDRSSHGDSLAAHCGSWARAGSPLLVVGPPSGWQHTSGCGPSFGLAAHFWLWDLFGLAALRADSPMQVVRPLHLLLDDARARRERILFGNISVHVLPHRAP